MMKLRCVAADCLFMPNRNPPTSQGTEPSAILARGASVGRYLVLDLVGKGGMGEVYAAYDPELDRKIALKLLRAQGAAGADASEGRARLLREAQAIARLSDPNVVVVYDVGTFEDRVFLAMEFVDGNTLTDWLEARTRTWREVVETFAAAGRGLAAAHRAGVVHRDFKPDNVMIGRDGKVRVMDFGLARAIEASASSGSPDDLSQAPPAPAAETAIGTGLRRTPSRSLVVGDAIAALPAPQVSEATTRAIPGTSAGWTEDDRSTRDLAAIITTPQSAAVASPLNSALTVTGAMMGTPAYMAPEQFAAKPLDARTDQFSFCVALYEGLYKDRPFAGKSILELSASVCAGRVRPPPAHARVPGWLRRVLLRGLRVSSAERHESMESLLRALARDPARTQRRGALALSLTSLVVVMALGLVRAQRQQRMRCLGSEAKLAGIWELASPNGQLSARKEAIRRAFMATGKRYAADSFTVVQHALDRYVAEWADMHRDACEATNVRGEQSAEVLDLRMSCLNDHLSEVRALANVFSSATGEVVGQSVKAAQGVRPIEPCADIVALRAIVRPPDDPAVRRAVSDVRTQLADVKALAISGRYKDGGKAMETVVAAARATNYDAVIAEALLQLAEIQDYSNFEQAEGTYEQAIWFAESAHHDEVVVEATDQLVFNVGYYQNRQRDALRWAALAEARLKRLGPGHDVLVAWRQNNLAAAYAAAENVGEALTMFQMAVTTKIRVLGGKHFDVAVSMGNVAFMLNLLGRNDDAIAENSRALEILQATVGPEHPAYARIQSNSALFMFSGRRFAEAAISAQQALSVLERELSPDHPELSDPLLTLGQAKAELGDATAGIASIERALGIRISNGTRRSTIGDARWALAKALVDTDPERARSLAEEARADYTNDPQKSNRLAEIGEWLEPRANHSRRISMR